MSDEQTPPPSALRLKPRLLATSAPFPSPAPTEAPDVSQRNDPPAPPPSPTSPPPKISLKPRLEQARPESPSTAEAAKAETFGVTPPVYPAYVPNADTTAQVPAPASTTPAQTPASGIAGSPPLVATTSPPAPMASPAEGEVGKFKLRPKVPPPIAAPLPVVHATPPPMTLPPAASEMAAPPPPPVMPRAPSFPPPPIAPMPPTKVPPPFPVVAQGTTPPPPTASVAAPQLKLKTAPIEAAAASLPGQKPSGRPRSALIGVAALIVIAAGSYFAWQRFMVHPATAPANSAKTNVTTPAVKSAPSAPATSTPPAGSAPAITPSETLNKIAAAPANAINKAQEAIATRRASGQTRIDAALTGEEVPDRPGANTASAAAKAAPPATKSAAAATTLAPGLTATTELEAGAEASPAFRAFIANAKVSGVFQGSPSRAFINGRLMRPGDIVDNALGVVFTGVDADRKQLLFKDRTGAVVARKY